MDLQRQGELRLVRWGGGSPGTGTVEKWEHTARGAAGAAEDKSEKEQLEENPTNGILASIPSISLSWVTQMI